MTGPPRRPRKSCSLPNCFRAPGECMHCTCDGRCGHHAPGMCGGRREGGEKNCRKDDCPKDHTCLHSTRATCCHCRNAVCFSNKLARKRARSSLSLAPLGEPVQPQVSAVPDASSGALKKLKTIDAMTEDDEFAVDFASQTRSPVEVEAIASSIVTAAAASSAWTEPTVKTDATVNADACAGAADARLSIALCEYPEYAARREHCNLVVLVDGVQFNLHKHPVLLESQWLNAKARECIALTGSPVPIVRLASFPGGADAFERLCIYAYTGEIDFPISQFAALYAGIHLLNMGLCLKQRAQGFLSQLMAQDASLASLLVVIEQAARLTRQSAVVQVRELFAVCVDAAARMLPLSLQGMDAILALPSYVFLHITQRVLITRGPPELAQHDDMLLLKQAEFAQLYQDALDRATKTQQCLVLLQDALLPPLMPALDVDNLFDSMLTADLSTTFSSASGMAMAMSPVHLNATSTASTTPMMTDPLPWTQTSFATPSPAPPMPLSSAFAV